MADGGFTMLMGELATAMKYALPITVVVFKSDSLGMIKWEQMVFLGNPEYGCELQPIDFVKVRPALVEAVVDPFEAPMPARVKPEQALHMAESLARGEPNRGRIGLTLFRNEVRDLKGK